MICGIEKKNYITRANFSDGWTINGRMVKLQIRLLKLVTPPLMSICEKKND